MSPSQQYALHVIHAQSAMDTVSEWNKVFGIPAKRDLLSRLRITGSEIHELASAENRRLRADGLGDVLWTLCGTWIDLKCPDNRDVLRFAMVQREETTAPPEIEINYGLAVALMRAGQNPGAEATIALATAMRVTIDRMFVEFGVDGAERIFETVRKTNFAKKWTRAEVEGHWVSPHVKGPGDIAAPSSAGWTATPADADGAEFVVRDATGKVRKPPAWREPDWSWIQ